MPTPKRASKGGVEQETKVKKTKEEIDELVNLPMDEVRYNETQLK